MALASCTEVPPNFMTIMGGDSERQVHHRDTESQRKPFLDLLCDSVTLWCSSSVSQIPFGLEQLGIQQGGAGGAPDRIVREDGELPVEHVALAESTDGGGHAGAELGVEAGLWAIVRGQINDWLRGRARQSKLLRLGFEAMPGGDDFVG